MAEVTVQALRREDYRDIAAQVVIDTETHIMTIYDGWCMAKYQLAPVVEAKNKEE